MNKVLIISFLSLMFLTPVLASADVFKLGVLLDKTISEDGTSTFMEGFRIAVDQSPDISHPVGIEGGDHLGGIDVEIITVDTARTTEEFTEAVRNLVDRENVPIIIADVSPEILKEIITPVVESGVALLAISEAAWVEVLSPLFFNITKKEQIELLLSDRIPSFQEEFVLRYGRTPSEPATRGYIAGRLVDIAVNATNRNPFDQEALRIGLAPFVDISSKPTQSDVVVTPTESSTEEGGVNLVFGYVLLLAGLGLLLVRIFSRR